MVQENLTYVRALPSHVRDRTYSWVLVTIKGPEVFVPTGRLAGEFASDHLINPFPTTLPEMPEGIDLRMALFLWTYAVDLDLYSQCDKRLRSIFAIDSVCTPHCSPGPYRVSNAVYNYALGRSVPVVLCSGFLQGLKYNASFHNWSSNAVKLCLPTSGGGAITRSTSEIPDEVDLEEDFGEEDEEESLEDGPPPSSPPDEEKIRVHRFNISAVGTVKQTSPTGYKEALEKRTLVLSLMTEFFKQLDSGTLPEIPIAESATS